MITTHPTRRLFPSALLAAWCLGFGGGLHPNASAQTTGGKPNETTRAAAQVRVACVGDSITQGVHVRGEDNYPSVLAGLLGERYQVRNFGFLGGTVMNVNDRPYAACAGFNGATAFNPDIVVFMLGTNDSKPDEWKHKERFKQDLIALLDRFANLPAKPKIWLCTPAWVAKHYPGGHDEQIVSAEIVPLIRAVAAEKKLPLIDIHAAFEGKPDLYADGVHPNAAGCLVLAQAVHKALAPPNAEPPKPQPSSLRVDRMFSDHMVLQRDMPVPVWGTAAPGAAITVAFRDQKKQVQTAADGKWQVKLEPLKAGEPAALTISDAKDNATMTFTDVLIGEVWIGSGQSNMDGRTGGYRKGDEMLNTWAEDAPNRKLRFYNNQKKIWEMATPESVGSFSALGFAFCYSLTKELNVPVGMMVVAYGGRPSGEWLTPEMAAASSDPVLRKLAWSIRGGPPPENMDPAVPPGKPAAKPRFLVKKTMGVHYLKEISRFRPFAIRGVLWDQGEAGTALEGVDQFTAMSALIAGWRKDWGQGDFPFLHMQKPSGGGCAWDPADPIHLKAVPFTPQPANPSQMSADKMRYTLNHIRMGTIRNAPLVTTVDLAPSVHPPTKAAYGARACRVALGAVYGRDIAICGPVYQSHKVEGNKIRIAFDHLGKGLAFRQGDKLLGFEIAGADGKWDWAEAKIDGTTVVARNAAIPQPVHVRYAYSPQPGYANLFNKDGLPALTFTTEPLGKAAVPSQGR